MKNNFQWWLVKIDRFGAWVLLATVVLFFVTSYGMEKGFLDQKTTRWLHTDFLPVVGAVAFIMHTGPAVRMALICNKLWNKITKTIFFAIYIFLAAGFVWAAFFINPVFRIRQFRPKNKTKRKIFPSPVPGFLPPKI